MDHLHHHHDIGEDDDDLDLSRPPGAARIGIGGPVGSGKTALIEALVPLLIAAGHRPLVVTNDIFTKEDEHHVRATLTGVLASERIVGVETGSCPHAAVRDDPSMNLEAISALGRRFPDADFFAAVAKIVVGNPDSGPAFACSLGKVAREAHEDRISSPRVFQRHRRRFLESEEEAGAPAWPPAGTGSGRKRRGATSFHHRRF